MSTTTMRMLVVAGCAGLVSASSFYAQEVSKDEASASLLHELEPAERQSERWQDLKNAFLTTYTALPKNEHGFIDHQAARYALHRFFVQRNGWYIKGLEPTVEHKKPEGVADNTEQLKKNEWVTGFLQEKLEEKSDHKGLDLDGLVALAATVEDLVAHETEHRLQTAYEMEGFPLDAALSRADAKDVVRTWYVGFLLAGNFTANSREDAHAKKAVFERRYADWSHAEDWLDNLEAEHFGDSTSPVEYASLLRLVSKIGATYFHFNDKECSALKHTLQKMEGKKAGRVRLSTFYSKSLYSHWRFTEKADYLRRLGALDESDGKTQHVLVTNYVMSRPNCLETSGLYALCCRNECEDLMGHLEEKLKKSEAEPREIAALVAQLPSDTVQIPRTLDATLLDRLEQVAAVNGGKVPLHGRLFAQWMHHAYPRECPYPHEFGTTSPMTPDEWMQATGQSDSSASNEEMKQQVDNDVCKLDAEGRPMSGCDEAADLPWSETEQLLGSPVQVSSRGRGGMILPAALAAAVALALVFDYWRTSRWSQCSKGDIFYVNAMSSRDLTNRLRRCQKSLGAWLLAVTAWLMDFVDGPVFAASMAAGLVLLGVRGYLERRSTKVV